MVVSSPPLPLLASHANIKCTSRPVFFNLLDFVPLKSRKQSLFPQNLRPCSVRLSPHGEIPNPISAEAVERERFQKQQDVDYAPMQPAHYYDQHDEADKVEGEEEIARKEGTHMAIAGDSFFTAADMAPMKKVVQALKGPGAEKDDDENSKEQQDFDQVKELTIRMSLRELLKEAHIVPILVEGDQDVEITGIQHDSRQVVPGTMFVCCPGYTTDEHLYLAEASEKGAVVIVSSKKVSVQESVKAVILVEDTNAILSALSAAFYGNPSNELIVIGITGTNGKTTTSYLLKSMYEAMGLKTGLLGTIAYYINGNKKLKASLTTPDAVSLQRLMATMVHNGSKVCVMEVSSHALVLDRCKVVDFNVAVFTNLTRDHLDFHKTEENYKEAKGRLFAKMVDSRRHMKVVNLDDSHVFYFTGQGNADVPIVTFSMENKKADVYALEVQLSLYETKVLVHTPRGNTKISSKLIGRHNIYNILTAVAVGTAVDAPLEDIVQGIERVEAVPGRCERIDEEQDFAVIVDYAHTPDALSRLLDTVRECGARRIITVVGCGGDRDRGKRPIMAKIATDKSDVCILTSDNPRTEDPFSILDDMLAGVGWSMKKYLEHNEKNVHVPLQNGHMLQVCEPRSIAVRAAVAMGEEGDAVVIAGKGHEDYQIIGDKKEHFDDREVCRKALQHMNAFDAAFKDMSEFSGRLLEHH